MEYMTSSFGVNIATGLMLESVMDTTSDRIDDSRKIPNKVNLKNYKKWYFNLSSFINNVINSFDKDTVDRIINNDTKHYKLAYERVLVEIDIVHNLLNENVEVVYYNIEYKKYKPILNPIDTKTKSGKLSIVVAKMFKEVESYLLKNNMYLKYINTVDRFKFESNSLITTSIGLDLIQAPDSVHLLEYHTGVLKKRDLWYTKVKVKDRIPFEELLVLAYGDKKGIINSGLSIKEKRNLTYSIMNKKLKPYARYSKSSILSSIEDVELKEKLKKLPTILN